MVTCRKCRKKATHYVPNYYVGEARDRVGPSLMLCETHASEWNTLHPFDQKAIPGKKTAEKLKQKT